VEHRATKVDEKSLPLQPKTKKNMENTRLNRIERLLQKELGDMFIHVSSTFKGTILSVSEVRISPDLSVAKAYISVFPQSQSEYVIETLKNSSRSIRYELGKRIKNQVRVIPELIFKLDETLDKLETIDRLLAVDRDAVNAATENDSENQKD
jgi:ribosome-binding factor A